MTGGLDLIDEVSLLQRLAGKRLVRMQCGIMVALLGAPCQYLVSATILLSLPPRTIEPQPASYSYEITAIKLMAIEG